MPQQTVLLAWQSVSEVHSFKPAAAGWQVRRVLASVVCTQAWPIEVSHMLSLAQNLGHALAFWQILPLSPKSQHSSPWLVLQSWSFVQVLSQAEVQRPGPVPGGGPPVPAPPLPAPPPMPAPPVLLLPPEQLARTSPPSTTITRTLPISDERAIRTPFAQGVKS
jgi:hypothetical protein